MKVDIVFLSNISITFCLTLSTLIL